MRRVRRDELRTGNGRWAAAVGRWTARLFEPRRNGRRGTVFVAALWVTLALAGLVLVFARSMRVEYSASAHHAAALGASLVERGAEQYVLAVVEAAGGDVRQVVEAPAEAMRVGDGYFWILRVDPESPSQYRFGIVDESSKLNLNRANVEMLTRMPGIPEDLAAAIVDWRDRDSEITPGGAESEYYLTLPVPYYAKDAPYETMEELLLVRGVTRELLYGDRYGSGTGFEFGWTLGPEYADRGIFHLLTVYGTERNVTPEGDARVNVNRPSGSVNRVLREALSDERYAEVQGRVQSQRPFRNMLDFHIRTGLTMEEFRRLEDRVTTSRRRARRGPINVNTAPAEVLYAMPGLTEADVAELLIRRGGTDVDLNSIAWVAEALEADKAVAIGGQITTRSSHYTAELLSVDGSGRSFRRSRIVVDAREEQPIIVYRQDLSDRGWPLSYDLLEAVRTGGAVVATESRWSRTRR
jgi:type II secretory pathway component PulK